MEIYQALQQDHRTLQELMKQLLELDHSAENEGRRAHLLDQIREEFIPHSRAEEYVFYNSIRALDKSRAEMRHSYKEHMEAETLLRTLQIMDMLDLEWEKTARKFSEAVNHHIENEESKIFAIARSLFSLEEAEMMTVAFERMKLEVKKQGFMKTTMEAITNLMPPRLAPHERFKGQAKGKAI